jgi:hypothetical protein
MFPMPSSKRLSNSWALRPHPSTWMSRHSCSSGVGCCWSHRWGRWCWHLAVVRAISSRRTFSSRFHCRSSAQMSPQPLPGCPAHGLLTGPRTSGLCYSRVPSARGLWWSWITKSSPSATRLSRLTRPLRRVRGLAPMLADEAMRLPPPLRGPRLFDPAVVSCSTARHATTALASELRSV